jgi:hypothetical protein
MRINGLRWETNQRRGDYMSSNELAFLFIRGDEEPGRGSCSDEVRMHNACKASARDMWRGDTNMWMLIFVEYAIGDSKAQFWSRSERRVDQ